MVGNSEAMARFLDECQIANSLIQDRISPHKPASMKSRMTAESQGCPETFAVFGPKFACQAPKSPNSLKQKEIELAL
jgi:hypothetical protein